MWRHWVIKCNGTVFDRGRNASIWHYSEISSEWVVLVNTPELFIEQWDRANLFNTEEYSRYSIWVRA